MTEHISATRRENAFRDRQRAESTSQIHRAAAKKAQQTLEIVQFSGWPTIENMNYSAYSGLMFYVRTMIHPDTDYERAVGNIIVNLFSKTPGCFCREGEYNKAEREHVKSQLTVFNRSIRTLECLIGLGTSAKSGNIGQKRIYAPMNMADILRSPVYNGSEEMDLIALHYSGRGINIEEEKPETIREALLPKYQERVQMLADEFSRKHTKDMRVIEAECDKFDIDIEGEDFESLTLQEYRTMVHEQIAENPDISDMAKDYLTLTIGIKDLLAQVDDEVKKQEAKNEAEKQKPWLEIPAGFSRSLAPRGILIVDAPTAILLDGLRQVDSYKTVTVYQRDS